MSHRVQTLHRYIVGVVGTFACAFGPLDQRCMLALSYLLRLLVQHLLLHLLPGKPKVAHHWDHSQANAASGRKQERPEIAVIVFRGEVIGYGFVGEIAGSDDVRKCDAILAADAKTLRQVDLDEVPISPAKPAKGVQNLHDSS